MKVVYLKAAENVEENIITAFKNQKDMVVKIGDSDLILPMILNFTLKDFKILKRVLGSGFYRWLTDLRKIKAPSEAAMDTFSFKVRRIVRTSKATGSDIVVIFEENENIDLLRDELKLWIRTK